MEHIDLPFVNLRMLGPCQVCGLIVSASNFAYNFPIYSEFQVWPLYWIGEHLHLWAVANYDDYYFKF
jgi:hypothetical protein